MGVFKTLLEVFWKHLEAIFKDFLSSWAKRDNSKKPEKTNGFALIFGVRGEFQSSKNFKRSMQIRSEKLSEVRKVKNEAKRGTGTLRMQKM